MILCNAQYFFIRFSSGKNKYCSNLNQILILVWTQMAWSWKRRDSKIWSYTFLQIFPITVRYMRYCNVYFYLLCFLNPEGFCSRLPITLAHVQVDFYNARAPPQLPTSSHMIQRCQGIRFEKSPPRLVLKSSSKIKRPLTSGLSSSKRLFVMTKEGLLKLADGRTTRRT